MTFTTCTIRTMQPLGMWSRVHIICNDNFKKFVLKLYVISMGLECMIQLPEHTWGLADDSAHHFV